MHEWLILSTSFNAVVAFVSGLFVYQLAPKNQLHQAFGTFCFFMMCWAIFYFFPAFPDNYLLSKLSFKLLHIGAAFIAIAHFYFIVVFLGIYEKYKKVIYAGFGFNLIFIPFIAFSELFIEDVVHKFTFGYWAVPGLLYHLWLIVWLGFILWSVMLLIKHYKLNRGLRRKQIGYVLLGDLMTFTFGSTNFFLFYNINILPVFNILSSGQMMLFAYTILRFRYYELQSIFAEIVRKIVVILVSVSAAVLIDFYIKNLFNVSTDTISLLMFSTVAVSSYIIFESLIGRHWVHRILNLANNQLFAEANKNLIEQNRFYQSTNELNKTLQKVLCKRLGIQKVIIIENNLENKNIKKINTYFKKNKKSELLVTENLRFQDEINKKDSALTFSANQLGEVIFPIYFRNEIIGFWLVGSKQSGDLYFEQEIKILQKTNHYITIYLSFINYNKTLKSEVSVKTEQLKKANAKLKRSYKKLQELDALKDDFISVASHELRTPMTIIRGYTDFLLSEKFGTVNKQQKEFLTNIFESTKDLIHLTNNMLDISRIEADTFNIHLEKTDLSKWIQKITNDFTIICEEKKIKITLEQKIKKKNLSFDRGKFEQVLKNIIGNAYKMTPNKGKIKVVLTEDKSQYLIEVKDTGPGIAKEKQEIIFEKFQQLETGLRKRYSGSGLGLNIVKKIVEYFGGKVWVESAGIPGKGSSFFFTIQKKLPKKIELQSVT